MGQTQLKNNNPPKHRMHIVPATYLILREGNQILLLRRANTGYMDGSFSLPAGHLDGDESPKAAGVREAQEELGITVHEKDLTFAHVLYREASEGDYERVDFFFELQVWEGDITNCEPEKCSELAWYELSDLPSNMTPEVSQALACLAKGEGYSSIGL